MVRAPKGTPAWTIEELLAQRAQWIYHHQNKVLDRCRRVAEARSTFPLSLPLLGVEYPVVYAHGPGGVREGIVYLPPCRTAPDVAKALEQLYRAQAKEYLPGRTLRLAEKYQLYPTRIQINGARGRWGSCSGKNSLNFSWRLMLADVSAVDYVICHELAHIKHHNHSQSFWQLVREMRPDYQASQNHLKELEQSLFYQSWCSEPLNSKG